MRGHSADEVAHRILNNTSYPGLQVCLLFMQLDKHAGFYLF